MAALLVIATVLALLAPSRAAFANLPPGDGDSTVAKAVAALANKEYSNVDGHKFEKPIATNCNYFTTATWHASGATNSGCSVSTWYKEEWCMDFSRWVYKTSNASVADLSHLAYSAKDYATYQTVSSGRKPRVGDLAVWANESHVGIVVAVSSSGVPTVVSGNSYNPAYPSGDDMHKYSAIWKSTYSVSTFQGFAAPLHA